MCSTEVVNLVNRLQGGWNRICICAGRYLSIGRYPIAGSIATHRSYHFCVRLKTAIGCKYHRRVSLLSSQISRPVGLVPSQDSNAGGLPVGRCLGGVRRFGDLEIIESLEVSDVIRRRDAHFLVEVFDVERGFCRRCGECVYSPAGL